MSWPIKIQGRFVTEADVKKIRSLMDDNPLWNRSRLSQELCQLWHWQRPDGQMKDIACRELLRKLEHRALITLPPRQRKGPGKSPIIATVDVDKTCLTTPLAAIQPISIVDARRSIEHEKAFNFLLAEYHYLSYRRTVGQNMKYLILSNTQQILGCLLFGAAAWKTEARDGWIGWSPDMRERNLGLLCNNTRFLILDWIKIPHLASHVLGACLRRLSADWKQRYGTGIALVETFVDTTLYRGTCYKAANWIRVGETKGRSRQDRKRILNTSIKDVLVYPLQRDYRQRLLT